eukprot:UN04143
MYTGKFTHENHAAMYMHSSKKRNRNDFQSSINEGSHLKDTVRTDISYKVNKKRKKKI